MSNKLRKNYRFAPEFIKKIMAVAKRYKKTETTIIEAAVTHFLSLPEDHQKVILSRYFVGE